MNAQAPPINMHALAEEYVKLRDFKKQQKDAFEEYLQTNVNQRMDEIEGIALQHLNDTGVDSVKTAAGTVYRKKHTSITVADPREFNRYIIGGGLWDLADIRASKTGVETFLAENQALPPGINYSTAYVIGVRRGSE